VRRVKDALAKVHTDTEKLPAKLQAMVNKPTVNTWQVQEQIAGYAKLHRRRNYHWRQAMRNTNGGRTHRIIGRKKSTALGYALAQLRGIFYLAENDHGW